MKIERMFYARSALEVAKDLLGKTIVHKVDGVTLKGKIVETEAYIGAIDKASLPMVEKKQKELCLYTVNQVLPMCILYMECIIALM